MKPTALPYLSIVAASRNDDHGGDPLRRTQIFVNALFIQCLKHRLPVELILVDWNPPPDRPKLHAALDFSRANEYCATRVIEVPAIIHQQLECGDRLPFFQMIAKNVGIRHARGRFVLATNIDILFSDELMGYLASRPLDPKRMYRVDRYDVDNKIPTDNPLDEQLKFCWHHVIRINRRGHIGPPDESALVGTANLDTLKKSGYWHRLHADGKVHFRVSDRNTPPRYLHTNACGDFTLLSREAWQQLHGYPEFEAYSFHIDSLFCYMAHYSNLLETVLAPPCVAFHIEHSIGSGWSPEGHHALFDRLAKAGIPTLENGQLKEWGKLIRASAEPFLFNNGTWGLGQFLLKTLPDHNPQRTVMIVEPRRSNRPACTLPPVSSLHRELDFHKIQAAYLRRENQRLRMELQKLQIGWYAWLQRTTSRWTRSYHKRAAKVKYLLNNFKCD